MVRLEAGMLKLNKQPVYIDKLLQQAAGQVSSHQLIMKSKGPLPKINIDAQRIGHVLDHLIDNAVKYSPPGSVITIEARKQNGEVLVSVSDQGKGIPAGELEAVFGRMYGVERPRRVGGLRLSLAFCKGLVELHGGRIWAKASRARGALSVSLCLFHSAIRKCGRRSPACQVSKRQLW